MVKKLNLEPLALMVKSCYNYSKPDRDVWDVVTKIENRKPVSDIEINRLLDYAYNNSKTRNGKSVYTMKREIFEKIGFTGKIAQTGVNKEELQALHQYIMFSK